MPVRAPARGLEGRREEERGGLEDEEEQEEGAHANQE